MRKKHNNTKGIALITILVFLSIFFMLGMALVSYAGSDFFYAAKQRDSLQAFYNAYSGILYAQGQCSPTSPSRWTFPMAPVNQKIENAGEFTVTASQRVSGEIGIVSAGKCARNTRILNAILTSAGTLQEWYSPR